MTPIPKKRAPTLNTSPDKASWDLTKRLEKAVRDADHYTQTVLPNPIALNTLGQHVTALTENIMEHTFYLRENTTAQQNTVTAITNMTDTYTHTIKSINLVLKAIHSSICETTTYITKHQQTHRKTTDELTHQLKLLNTGIAKLTQQVTPTQTDPN